MLFCLYTLTAPVIMTTARVPIMHSFQATSSFTCCLLSTTMAASTTTSKTIRITFVMRVLPFLLCFTHAFCLLSEKFFEVLSCCPRQRAPAAGLFKRCVWHRRNIRPVNLTLCPSPPIALSSNYSLFFLEVSPACLHTPPTRLSLGVLQR